MPRLSKNRQIALPKALCERLSIEPGDELEAYEWDGRITLVKIQNDNLRGALSKLDGLDYQISDQEARDRGLDKDQRPAS